MLRTSTTLATLSGLATLNPAAFAQVPLQSIGTLPLPHVQSNATGVSADGSTVFGTSSSPTAGAGQVQPVIWTAAGGLESLGHLGGSFSTAIDASTNGSVIVGTAWNAGGSGRAFRWTRPTGIQDIGAPAGLPASHASGITPDGAVICGYGSSASVLSAFRWTQAGGMQELGAFRPIAMSANGNAIICTGGTAGSLWTSASGIQPLPFMNVPSWFPNWLSTPKWISPDGQIIFGTARDQTGDWHLSYRYSVATGYQGFLNSANPWWNAIIDYVSPDGRILLGRNFFSQIQYAVVDNVERPTLAYLQSRGADLSGWAQVYITGISADQRTFVGNGVRSTYTEGWVVTLPASCYPNCDQSTSTPLLTANDFTCFVNQFAANNSAANCDNSTGNPLLTPNDFTCFVNAYAAGCP